MEVSLLHYIITDRLQTYVWKIFYSDKFMSEKKIVMSNLIKLSPKSLREELTVRFLSFGSYRYNFYILT